MIRFFVDPEVIESSGSSIMLSAEDSEHIRSLRLRPDELFVVCDGKGTDYLCRLADSHKAGSRAEGTNGQDETDGLSRAKIIKQQKSQAEPSLTCIMYIAYAKGERLDYAVQKSVELGAHKIVLFKSERCIAVPNDADKKIERLQRIALETAKQSGRGVIPEVSAIGGLKGALEHASHSDLVVLCYEDESNLHLMTVLEHYFPFVVLVKEPTVKVETISVITGPEGGFEPSEIRLAKSMDIPIVTLGPRILRCETAPVAVLSAIMYHTGNL